MSTVARPKYFYYWTSANDGEWRICSGEYGDENVVFSYRDGPEDEKYPPQAVRDEYEKLIGWQAGNHTAAPMNLVEMIADDEGGGFNQICRFGSLVPGHSVYCHNTSWLYAPKKCRRTWYTGGETRDEDCEGFQSSPSSEPIP